MKISSAQKDAHGMRGTAVAVPSCCGTIRTGSGDVNRSPINPATIKMAAAIRRFFLLTLEPAGKAAGDDNDPLKPLRRGNPIGNVSLRVS